MAANIFGRYVWLIEQFRRYGRLTYEEVNDLWHRSGLSYGDDDDLALRTFHNHRKAIFDIFEVEIACDIKGGYKYYIDHPEDLEKDNLRIWLIDSYTAMNQIQADRKLKGRIIFENVPSGHKWLNVITDAMRNNQVLTVTHQGFGKPEPWYFDIEPYYLKVVKRRWYVLARSPYYSNRNCQKNKEDGGDRPKDVFLVYALDRILDCKPTGSTFRMKEDFDIDEYYRGCCGIIHSKEEPIRVVLKAYNGGPDYLRTLPIHESQRELVELKEDEASYFELTVRPTFDLYQSLLAQADQIEVLEPADVWFIEHDLGDIPSDENNLLISTALQVKSDLQPHKLVMTSDIPLARGLGSSSSVIVAGIELANQLADLKLSDDDKLDIATKIEGHPDNVAPAIFGNLVVASYVDEHVNSIVTEFPECAFVAFIPSYELKTSESRGALPSDLSYKDAVAASSIANVAIAALFAGDLVKAGRAIQGDMFHERYRQKLVKEFATIKELSGQYGAYATYLSGAGPTVMTLTPKEQAEALKTAIDGLGLDGETFILSVDKGGVVVD